MSKYSNTVIATQQLYVWEQMLQYANQELLLLVLYNFNSFTQKSERYLMKLRRRILNGYLI